MKLYYQDKMFFCECSFQEKDYPKKAGFKWNKEIKKWYTENKSSAYLLSTEVKMKFEGYEDLIDISLAKAPTKNLDIPAPVGLEYLPFQKACVEYAIEKGNILIADEMGLGKTIEAIGIINYLTKEENKKLSVIIVCPNSLKLNWLKELQKWLYHKRIVFLLSANSFIPKYQRDRGDIIIVNYDIIKKLEIYFMKWSFDIAIFDEAHYLKNEKALRTIYCKKIEADRKYLLTGTPIMNRPIELLSLLQIINSPIAQNRGYFIYRYCRSFSKNGSCDTKGAMNLSELNAKLRDNCMIRRLKRDVLAELPEKRRQLITIEAITKEEIEAVNNEMKKFYETKKKRDEMSASLYQKKISEQINAEEYAKEVENIKSFVISSIREISELRQQTALLKIPYIVEAVDTLIENEEKVIIFAYHHRIINALYENLKKYNPVVITGDTSIEDRDLFVKQFQDMNSNVKVIILNIKAGGVGITLHASSNVIFAELDWTPANISQAEDRAHRIGQKSSVNVYHYVIDGSIDCYLAKKILEKQEIIDKSLNYKIENIDMFDIIPEKNDKNNIDKQQKHIEKNEIEPLKNTLF